MNALSLRSMFGWVSWRDLILAWRHRADVLATLFFFIIVTSLFPLGIGPEPQTLQTIAPGIVWVAALLASMLSLGRIFGNDYQDGTLEQLLLTPQPAYLVVLAKVLAHWLVSEVPLVIIAPVLGLQFGLSENSLLIVVASLLLGTPVLSLVGAIGRGGHDGLYRTVRQLVPGVRGLRLPRPGGREGLRFLPAARPAQPGLRKPPRLSHSRI